MDISGIYLIFSVLIAAVFLHEVQGRRRRQETCGDSWIAMHRACYKFDKRPMNWSDAKAACREEGGNLISISSKAEMMKTTRELKTQITKPGLKTWWIGLKFNTEKGTFLWEDGGPFSRRITRWGPGEPNNGRGRKIEHCVELNFQGRLNDKECADLRPFICERHEITQRPTFQTTVQAVTSTSTTIATTSATTASTPTTTQTTTVQTSSPTVQTTKTTSEPTTKHVVETSPKPTSGKPSTSVTPIETSSKMDTSSEAETSTIATSTTTSTTLKTTTSTTTTSTTTTSTTIRTTPSPSWRTTLSVLTSTTWEEKLSPFHGCFQLSESNAPLKSNGIASAALIQQYEQGATTCPAAYASNMMWPATPTGTFSEIRCKSGNGKATWRCGSNPTCWRGEPNLAGCASPKFKKILKKVLESSGSKEEPTQEEQVEMTSALVEVTATDEMSVEDVMLTSKVIQSLATQSADAKPKDEKAVKSIVKNVVKAGSNVVAENKSSTWQEMAPEDKVRSASNLLVAMESTTSAMAAIIDHPTVIETKDENIDLELHVVDVSTLDAEPLVYDDQGSDNTISIPIETLKSVSKGGLTKAVFMTHYKMADLLEERPKKAEDNRPKTKIASSILSASLGMETMIHLPEPITFTMKHVYEVPKDATRKCSFWDLRQDNGYGRWSQEGCTRVGTNSSHTTCQCTHLTNFAILMDVEGVQMDLLHEKLLQFITMVGCVISILCLVASWLTFMCFGSLQGERNSIHKNLVACLFVAELLFVVGIDMTENKLACTLIAGFLHFFFLCTFMWMFIEGVHMVVMLVQVFDAAKSRLPYYYMTAYGIPLIIIAISAGFNYQGYGTDRYCWLTKENYFIWSFAGPVALILLVNAVILMYAMVMVCRHSEYVLNSKEKNSGSMRTWVQGALSMEVLLGLTWTFGYFFISQETIVMAYIFTILNSLQGLFIFCFHCLLNKKVLKEYKRVLHISKRRPSASTQSASLMRKQSQSYEMSGSRPTKENNC